MVFICTSQLLWRCQNLWSRIFSDQSLLRDTTVITAQGFGKVNAVMFSVLLFWFLWCFFFHWFFNNDCNARMTRWLSFYTRTAHFLADFFAIIARLTLSSKRAMWSSLLISKIFCLRSSRLQFRRNYWSTIFLTFGLALSQFFRLVSFPRGILEPERINFERDVRINRLQAV